MEEFVIGAFAGLFIGMIVVVVVLTAVDTDMNRAFSCMADKGSISQCQDILGVRKSN